MLLGETVWRRRFNADPSVPGSIVRLNGVPYTVVGVVPSAVQFRRPAEIWTVGGIPRHPRLRAADSMSSAA